MSKCESCGKAWAKHDGIMRICAKNQLLNSVVKSGVAENKKLRKANDILCAFINKEMKMTAADPRAKKLAKMIAKL